MYEADNSAGLQSDLGLPYGIILPVKKGRFLKAATILGGGVQTTLHTEDFADKRWVDIYAVFRNCVMGRHNSGVRTIEPHHIPISHASGKAYMYTDSQADHRVPSSAVL